MCGLVGVAGNITAVYQKVFQQLLYVDALRGWDSTGVLMVDPKQHWHYSKAAVGAAELMELKSYQDLLEGTQCVLLGHNRQATVGDVKHTNAHPFHTGKIIGAHNGTLMNRYSIPEANQFETDSQALFNSIDKRGLQETCKLIYGAWALSWWNEEEGSLNFLRNDQRPLNICYSVDNKTLFWASEPKMLEWILSRNKVIHTPIVELKVGYHYKFPDVTSGNPINNFISEEVEEEEHPFTTGGNIFPVIGDVIEMCVEVPGKWKSSGAMFRFPYWDVAAYSGRFPDGKPIKAGQWVTGEISAINSKTKTYTLNPKSLKQKHYVQVANPLEGDYDDVIEEDCAWCGSPIMPEESAVRTGGCVICESCQEFDEVKQYLVN